MHVKSKGISTINTFNVECDLVAKRLVLKDDGKAELYSAQSLFYIKLAEPVAQTSLSVHLLFWIVLTCLITLFRLEVVSFPKIQRLFRFSSYFHCLLEKVAKASL